MSAPVRWLLILVAALALVAAGCGGSDDEPSASDDTAIEETTTTDTTTSEDTPDPDLGDLSDVREDEDCQDLVNIGLTFSQALSGATDADAAEAFQQLADNVPSEIQADVQVLADWFAEYASKMQDIGLEAGQVPSAEQLAQLQTALASLDQDEVTASSDRLSAWAEENCDAAGG